MLARPLRPQLVTVQQPITPPAPALDELHVPEFESPAASRALHCCLIGPTNAGKSTLLNALLDEPVSIVSERIHTTRENTLGYLTDAARGAQVQFIDAPGALGPHVPALRRSIWDAVRRASLALIVVDASDSRSHGQCAKFLSQLGAMLRQQAEEEGRRTETVLVLNKVDRVRPKARLLQVSARLHGAHAFDWPCLMLSALHGGGVRQLREWLLLMSKPGAWSVPAGMTHAQPPRTLAAEAIRAEILASFRQELPYLISQRTLGWTELRNGDLRIDQQLVVPRRRRSTAKIVERLLPRVGVAAKEQLSELLGRKVHLYLSVATSARDAHEL